MQPPTDRAFNQQRHFVETDDMPDGWVKIAGATSKTYTPGYDEDSGGSVPVNDIDGDRSVDWRRHRRHHNNRRKRRQEPLANWIDQKCLRVVVTYRDDIDRTYPEADDFDTDVDETLESTFKGSEFRVKRIDEENDTPEFQDAGGNAVDDYRAERREDTTATTTLPPTPLPSASLKRGPRSTSFRTPKAMPSRMTLPNDTLTYSLSGTDAKHFVIVGSVDHPESYDPDGDPVTP